MTQLLDRAIARARALSEIEQDEAAELLLWAMGDPKRRTHDTALAFNAGMEHASPAQWTSDAKEAYGKR